MRSLCAEGTGAFAPAGGSGAEPLTSPESADVGVGERSEPHAGGADSWLVLYISNGLRLARHMPFGRPGLRPHDSLAPVLKTTYVPNGDIAVCLFGYLFKFKLYIIDCSFACLHEKVNSLSFVKKSYLYTSFAYYFVGLTVSLTEDTLSG